MYLDLLTSDTGLEPDELNNIMEDRTKWKDMVLTIQATLVSKTIPRQLLLVIHSIILPGKRRRFYYLFITFYFRGKLRNLLGLVFDIYKNSMKCNIQSKKLEKASAHLLRQTIVTMGKVILTRKRKNIWID